MASAGGDLIAWALEFDTGSQNKRYAKPVITENYVYLVGSDFTDNTSFIVQTDHNGGVNWQRKTSLSGQNTSTSSAAADSSENLYVYSGGNDNQYIAKINTSGTLVGDIQITGGIAFGGQIHISGSNVYISGRETGFNDPVFIKLNTALSSISWARQSDTDQGGLNISTDSSGNVYALTYEFTGSTGSGDGIEWVIIKYNSSGTQQWSKRFRGVDGNNDDYPYGVDATSASSNLYVSGVLQRGEAHVLAISKSDGSTISWQKQINGDTYGFVTPPLVKTDSSGNVYYASPQGSSNKAFVMKLNSSGVVQWKNELTAFNEQGNDNFGFDVNDDFFVISGVGTLNSTSVAFKAPTDGSGLGTYGSYTYQSSSLTVSDGIMVNLGNLGASSTHSASLSAISMSLTTPSESLTLYG